MNAKKYKAMFAALPALVIVQVALAGPARLSTQQGNKLYKKGSFNEAVNKYDEALVEAPQALEPKFNKANSYYRLDDLGKATDLYRQVAAESKDMNLVAKAKYNLGNCSFQQGSKQRDSNLRKAIEDMETSIGHWRGVLDIDPENKKAAKNIEVTRLTIKDILDELNKQQQDPNQPKDPNQQQDPNQPQQPQQQQGSQQDPNQPQEQQQTSGQDPNQPQEPNQPAEQEQREDRQQRQKVVPDTTAQEILDREQRQRKERQILQRGGWQKVEKDW